MEVITFLIDLFLHLDEYLDTITIESCGKSRVYLGGLAETLHRRNLRTLYRQVNGE